MFVNGGTTIEQLVVFLSLSPLNLRSFDSDLCPSVDSVKVFTHFSSSTSILSWRSDWMFTDLTMIDIDHLLKQSTKFHSWRVNWPSEVRLEEIFSPLLRPTNRWDGCGEVLRKQSNSIDHLYLSGSSCETTEVDNLSSQRRDQQSVRADRTCRYDQRLSINTGRQDQSERWIELDFCWFLFFWPLWSSKHTSIIENMAISLFSHFIISESLSNKTESDSGIDDYMREDFSRLLVSSWKVRIGGMNVVSRCRHGLFSRFEPSIEKEHILMMNVVDLYSIERKATFSFFQRDSNRTVRRTTNTDTPSLSSVDFSSLWSLRQWFNIYNRYPSAVRSMIGNSIRHTNTHGLIQSVISLIEEPANEQNSLEWIAVVYLNDTGTEAEMNIILKTETAEDAIFSMDISTNNTSRVKWWSWTRREKKGTSTHTHQRRLLCR